MFHVHAPVVLPFQVPPDTGFQWTAEISKTPHGNKMSVAFLPLHGQEPDISKRSHLGFKLELSSHRKQCCSKKLHGQATCIMYYGACLCYYKLFQPLRLDPVMWEKRKRRKRETSMPPCPSILPYRQWSLSRFWNIKKWVHAVQVSRFLTRIKCTCIHALWSMSCIILVILHMNWMLLHLHSTMSWPNEKLDEFVLFIITVFLYLQTITNNKSELPVRVVRESIEEKKVILVLWTASIFLFWRKWPASLILHRVPEILCLGTSQLSKQGVWAAQMDRVPFMDSLLPQPCVCTSLLASSAAPSYHLTYWISKYTLLHNHSYNQMKICWKITLHFCHHHPLYMENLAIASIMFLIAMFSLL